jgi:hypothetical protein
MSGKKIPRKSAGGGNYSLSRSDVLAGGFKQAFLSGIELRRWGQRLDRPSQIKEAK